MKYLIKSNLILLVVLILPVSLFMYSFNQPQLPKDAMPLMIVWLSEGFLFKVGYDFLNYEHDYKYFVHRLPKSLFLISAVLLNILAIISICFMQSSYRFLLLIGLVFSNISGYLYYTKSYLGVLFVVICFPNFLLIRIDYIYWLFFFLIIIEAFALIYYIRHQKTRVYFDDNY